MNQANLVHYTASKLRYRPKNSQPNIHIHNDGRFYLFKSLIKRLDLDPKKDRILFSKDPETLIWFITKHPNGIPIQYSEHSDRYYFSSSELRTHIAKSFKHELRTIDTIDNFYMSCELSPSKIDNSNIEYFRLNLLT